MPGRNNNKLRIIPLGGLGEIGKNMTVYEFGKDIIVVDCGMGFPDTDMYGIDAVIPDITYLEDNASRIRGIFITHGHEDHIGAVPYVLKKINPPIYTTKLTAELIKLKLEEHHLTKQAKLQVVEPGQSIRAGCFTVEFIHINHSISDAVSFAIRTPIGTLVHTGDFKIDVTPVAGGMADLARLGQLGNEGVLALLPDSTNVEKAGHSESERSVGAKFDELFKDCDRRIIVTTFASNIDRIQQIINAAAKYRRKVGITGRSMENIMRVSTELGYMKVPDGVLVDMDKIKAVPKNKTVIITTGSQGEEMSALHRMAFSEHKQVDIDARDLIIMSSSAIPGNELTISRVIDELFAKGAEVIYGKSNHLHVSGHACQEELKMMIALTKPKFVIPLHGETRMLYKHAALARDMGVEAKNILVSGIGHVIELSQKSIKETGEVTAGQVMVDGSGVGDVGSVVLRDRRHLADEGMIVVIMTMSAESGALISEPEIVTRGFVYIKEAVDMMSELRRVVNESIRSCEAHRITDWAGIKSRVRGNLSGYLYKSTRRSPMILPVIIEV
ncbi:MAG: ribonuclease J [Oscillospiraceae bacterium]|nr:ribonuclease J [Oscillospiraceae bacterium]